MNNEIMIGSTVKVSMPTATQSGRILKDVRLVYIDEFDTYYGTAESFGQKMLVYCWCNSVGNWSGEWVAPVDELNKVLAEERVINDAL